MTHEVCKELLKKLPLVKEIPEFAKDNNFKSDATREVDKVHKAWIPSSTTTRSRSRVQRISS